MANWDVNVSLQNGGVYRADGRFPDPFADMASLAMPKSPKEMLQLCRALVCNNAIYASALRKVVSYFLTDLEVFSKSDKPMTDTERDKRLKFLRYDMQLPAKLPAIGMTFLTYGNAVVSVVSPPKWYLRCGTQGCDLEVPYRVVRENRAFAASYSSYSVRATCPSCKKTTTWGQTRRRTGDPSEVELIDFSLDEIDIDYDQTTDRRAYIWKIPELYRSRIRRGDTFVMESALAEVVEAVRSDGHILFDKDAVFHLYEPSMSGLGIGGWGYPRTLANFKLAMYAQILMRANEAIALDFVTPTRILSPDLSGGSQPGGDRLQELALGDWRQRLEQMLAMSRVDPGRWNIAPIPVRGQLLGGEANQLAPVELINRANGDLLSAIGFPPELFAGTITAQAAPAALRFLESHFRPYVNGMDRLLDFVASRVAKLMHWEPFGLRMRRVTHADDLNNQMAVLQLMQAGLVSRSTGLGRLNLDPVEEQRRMVEDERAATEAVSQVQQDIEASSLLDSMAPTPTQQMSMQAAQPQAGMAPGGAQPPQAPPGAGGQFAANMATTMPPTQGQQQALEQAQAQAETIAQTLWQLPESQKDSRLIQLKKHNEILHYLVRERLAELRREAEMQGAQMVQQGGAPM